MVAIFFRFLTLQKNNAMKDKLFISIIALAIIMASFGKVYSQGSQTYKIEGKVIDAMTENAIPSVGVYDGQGHLLGVADKDGCFKINVKQKTLLNFSHVSYEILSTELNINDIEPNDDGTYWILATMKKKVRILPEAVVVENAPELAYSNEEVWVVDYKVNDSGIFLITNNGVKSMLLHLSHSQDTISKRKIRTDFSELYEDGFGNVHLVGNDSTYQVFCDGETLHLLYGNSRKTFDEVLKPVVAVTDSVIVMENRLWHNQQIVYVAVNRNNSRRKVIGDISGETLEMAKHWNDGDRKVLSLPQENSQQLFYNNSNDNVNNHLPQADFIDVQNRMNERTVFDDDLQARLMLRPIYAPVYCIENILYIFDFLNDYLYKYNQIGDFIGNEAIVFHKKTGYAKKLVGNNPWDNNIIVDNATDKCYAQFINDTRITLKEVDLKSGDTKGSYTLYAHYFPQNIQVYNGFVYYLFVDSRKQIGDSRSLYKMELK